MFQDLRRGEARPSQAEPEHTHLPTCATHSTPTRRASLIIQRRGGGVGEGQGARRGAREHSGERIITTIKANKAHCRLNDKF